MRSLLVQCTTSLAAALTLASFGIHFLYGDNAPEIPLQAMKLNQRGLSHLHKKEYDQAIASFREALQIEPEYPDALDNLGKALDATGKDAEAMADLISTKPSKSLRTGVCRQGNGPLPRRELQFRSVVLQVSGKKRQGENYQQSTGPDAFVAFQNAETSRNNKVLPGDPWGNP